MERLVKRGENEIKIKGVKGSNIWPKNQKHTAIFEPIGVTFSFLCKQKKRITKKKKKKSKHDSRNQITALERRVEIQNNQNQIAEREL